MPPLFAPPATPCAVTPPGGFPVPDPLPHAVVISLDHLPYHGREVAEWLRQAKKRQGVPIDFVGGNAEKVAPLRSKFQHAIFCSSTNPVATPSRL